MNPLYADLPVTVFEVMSRLAREHDAVNLGQGFPDDPGPEDVRRKAADAVLSGWNQYPPMMGLPELRQAIAQHHKRFYGLDVDADRETLVTSGATEALADAIFALVTPGDEVVMFEPLYDAYLPLVKRAGGVPRLVTLKPPHWRFTEADLAAAFSPRTKVVLINDPLNPAASVWPVEDLDLLARFVTRCGAVVIQDAVWEHVLFDDVAFTPLITLPGMRDRVVHIGSAGKIFSLTGWKVGLVTAAPDLMRVIAKAHQFMTFTTPPNLQAAVAFGLGKDDSYFTGMRRDFQDARDHFVAGLSRLGLQPLAAQATYFVNVDLAPLGIVESDRAFAERLVSEGGVAVIPVSAFYDTGAVGSVIRFCFAKKRATLDAALQRLERFLESNRIDLRRGVAAA
jgi:N-succinyldiaminopimelate aminotransferase